MAKQADLEAWETALRAAVLACGAKVLAGLLAGIGSGRRPGGVFCPCGARMESQGLKSKPLLTILGLMPYGGNVEKIISQARQQLPKNSETRRKVEAGIHYCEKNKERMRYAEFRSHGLFVGSGVVEAGCKTVIGQRLKQSGMEWSVRGANAIIALR